MTGVKATFWYGKDDIAFSSLTIVPQPGDIIQFHDLKGNEDQVWQVKWIKWNFFGDSQLRDAHYPSLLRIEIEPVG